MDTWNHLPANGRGEFVLLGFSNSSCGRNPLPLDLSFSGMPGCSRYVELLTALAATRTGRVSAATLTIPGNAALLGTSIYTQGLVLDASANALGAVIGGR